MPSNSNRAPPPLPPAIAANLERVIANVRGMYNYWRGRPSNYKIATIALLLLGLLVLFKGVFRNQARSSVPTANTASWRDHFNWRSTSDKTMVYLVPGELPGYTGWARPGKTLAGHFQLVSPLDISPPAVAGEIWEMKIQCFFSECSNGGTLFFVRAYGPAVISGQVHDNKDGTYRIELLPKDPGPYTVEVVVTFSNPPSFGQFPLPPSEAEPGYEGYMLPDFPLPLQVVPGKGRNIKSKKKLQLCSTEELSDSSPTSAWETARWVVKDKINHQHYRDGDASHNVVTFAGYQSMYNSLGILMEYKYDKCDVLPAFSEINPNHPLFECAKNKGPLHFLFIGDSNMRLQRNVFEEYFLRLPEDQREKSRYNEHQIRASYHDLTGGALRCNILGGDQNVTRFFQMLYAREDKTLEMPERYVVLFNTGMHDIHRLCSHEFTDDRATYLGDNSAHINQGFHCVQSYRTAVEGLAGDVRNFKAALRVFQTTTAGWPKYGNYGVNWPVDGAQTMPVATDFIPFFNEIAYDVLKENFPTISIMDGYWISYARPDNREMVPGRKKVLEKKLSHPGLEVVLEMLRSWATFVAQSDVCA